MYSKRFLLEILWAYAGNVISLPFITARKRVQRLCKHKHNAGLLHSVTYPQQHSVSPTVWITAHTNHFTCLNTACKTQETDCGHYVFYFCASASHCVIKRPMTSLDFTWSRLYFGPAQYIMEALRAYLCILRDAHRSSNWVVHQHGGIFINDIMWNESLLISMSQINTTRSPEH